MMITSVRNMNSEFLTDLSTHHVALEASTSHVLATLKAIPSELHSRQPAEGWSVQQILDHLHRTEEFTLKLLKASGQPTEDRPPDEWVRKLEKALLRRDRQYPAPEVTLPSADNPVKSTSEQFENNRREMHAIIDQLDLSETCTLSAHPVIGHMTRIEWIYFTVYHGYRHAEQMQLLAEKLDGQA